MPFDKKAYERNRSKIIYDKAKQADKYKDFFDLPDETKEELLNQVRKLTKDKETGEEDPIMKVIEQVPKYMPLIQQVLAGFRDSQMARQFQQQQPQQAPRPQAPEGWLESSPLQRLSRKYSEPDWYNAGLVYERQMSVTYRQEATQYIDATYAEVAPQRQQELSRQNFIQAPQSALPQSNDSNLPDADKGNSAQLQQELQRQEAEKQNAKISNTPKQEEPKKQENDTLIAKLNEDNLKYLNMAIDYINGMKNEDVQKQAESPEGIFNQLRTLKPFLPIQVKEMIKNTKPEELENILKERSPEKHKLLKKEKLIKKLLADFEAIQKEL